MTPDDKNLEALEAIFHDAAVADAEDKDGSTPEEREWAKQLHARVADQLADMERNLAPAKSPKPIRPGLLAMARDTLLAKIDELVGVGRLQVAHRNLSTLSDDDLRRLLQSVEPAVE